MGTKSKSGFRAIDYALNNKDIRTILLKKGAKFNKEETDKKSLKKIQREIIKTIQKEMNIDDLDLTEDAKSLYSNGTFLSYAFKSKKAKDLRIAILKGANLNVLNVVDLVIKGYSAKFIDLAIKNGVKIDEVDENGKTALIHACELGKEKIVKILIKNRANIEIRDLRDKDVWDYASGNEEIMEMLLNYDEISAPNHNPKKLVKILSNFTRDTPMKYTTHIWDFGSIKTEYTDFTGFMKKIQKQWEKLEDALYELSPSLYKKIHNFLLEENEDTNGWFGDDNISIGWSSLKGLDKWCNEGKDPFKFKLEKSFIVDNEDISTFGDIINVFKKEIEFRKEYNMLEKLFIDIENNLDEKFSIETKKLSGKNFYTDVETFKKSLSNIFSEVQKRESVNIDVRAIDTTGEHIDLIIVQLDSEAQQSAEEMLKEVMDGDFCAIKEQLSNLCDWSIESSFEKISYRVNYLRSDKNIPEIEVLDYVPNGFTYKLRFYK